MAAKAPIAPPVMAGPTPWRPVDILAAEPPVRAAVPALRLPSEVRRRGTMLLNQQFWLWGQDIRRPDGNLLVQHGFVPERPGADVRGSTRYELALEDGRVVVLWGFGLFYGDPECGGLYLGRFRLSPRLGGCDVPRGVWEPSRLPRFAPPRGGDDWRRAGDLLVPALAWIGRYETWIATTVGAEYRRRCLAPWPRPVCGAAETAARWGRLSHRCQGATRRAARGGRFGTEQTGGERVKKQGLIEDVARRMGETEARAAVAVDAVFAAVAEAIADGDGVTIPGFGSFRVVERAPRNGRNPQTGEAMTIGARRAPVFRPGSRLKEDVAGSDGAAPGASGTDR